MRPTIAGLAIVAAARLLAAPFVAEAQPAEKTWRIGLVSVGSDPTRPGRWQPFVEAIRGLGYVEGRNLAVKNAFAKGRSEELPRLVDELLRSGVDVMVTTGTRETMAARRATSTVPIVMCLSPIPSGQGFVATLARPGGNVTGLTNLIPGLVQKYVELLKAVVPQHHVSPSLRIRRTPFPRPRELEAASKSVGVMLSIIPVPADDFDSALARAKRDRVGAILATSDPVTFRTASDLSRPRLSTTCQQLSLDEGVRGGWRPHELQR